MNNKMIEIRKNKGIRDIRFHIRLLRALWKIRVFMLQKKCKLILYFMILKPYLTPLQRRGNPLVAGKSTANIPYSLIFKQIGIYYIPCKCPQF